MRRYAMGMNQMRRDSISEHKLRKDRSVSAIDPKPAEQSNQRLRAQQREALRQAEHLFQTLLHQAFIGKRLNVVLDLLR